LRNLNQVTAEYGDDVWLLPRIDECLRRCAGMTWFTGINARSAFWSIPLARASRRYTAFSTPVGSYVWTVMPMGARCAPTFCQRVAEFLATPRDQNPDIKVAGFSDKESIFSYMDVNTILTNQTYRHHIKGLCRFLDKVIYHGFTLNLEKCQFLRTSVKLLRHTVG
jgi:hypothetical protein